MDGPLYEVYVDVGGELKIWSKREGSFSNFVIWSQTPKYFDWDVWINKFAIWIHLNACETNLEKLWLFEWDCTITDLSCFESREWDRVIKKHNKFSKSASKF